MELDLHIHSHYSFDSTSDVKKIVEQAKQAGLDGIAITDHDCIEGALEALNYVDENFIVIPAVEFGTTEGDILGYFIDTIPEPTKNPYEIISFIKERGGIAVVAHPFAYRLSLTKKLVSALHGAEGFNARHTELKQLPLSLGEEKVVEFALANNLVLTAGSDAHTLSEIGNGRTVIEGARSVSDVKNEILKGNTMLKGVKTGVMPKVWSFLNKLAGNR